VLLAAALLAAAPAARAAQSCDRACLTGIANQYLDAMAAQKPAGLPWAPTVRYAENSVPMAIGDGLWGAISARSKTGLMVADPKAQEVAWLGEVEEHGQPAFFAMTMKVEGGRIARVDAVIRRSGGPPEYSDPKAWTPDPAFGEAEKKPLTRAQLVAAVNGYLDAQEGKAATGGVEGCQAQVKAGVFKPIETVRARRFPVVDEARGVVVVEGFEDYPEREDVYAGHPAPAKYPYSLGFLAAFKIRDGGIYCIEDISTALPYRMPAP
jgi:hypothetical protein